MGDKKETSFEGASVKFDQFKLADKFFLKKIAEIPSMSYKTEAFGIFSKYEDDKIIILDDNIIKDISVYIKVDEEATKLVYHYSFRFEILKMFRRGKWEDYIKEVHEELKNQNNKEKWGSVTEEEDSIFE
jgi:hypothetical protein